MARLGISSTIAEKISLGSHLSGEDARVFVKKNEDIVVLTVQQQKTLLELKISQYENIVRRNISVPLAQHEFDALVSFAYNPGGHFTTVSQDINRGNIAGAMRTISSRIASGGDHPKGLANRRRDEVELFTNARY